MKNKPHKEVRKNAKMLARQEIVAQLYKRQYSFRKIQAEVMKRLGLQSYSLNLVKRDVDALLAEWRESRIDSVDDALQLELERIDDTCQELWEQWEKSKEDAVETESKTKGSPAAYSSGMNDAEQKIKPHSVEKRKKTHLRCGNPAYITEIRQQLQERRKLLGLYAPEKKDVTGSMSFTDLLVESGMLDAAEEEPEQE